MRLPKERKTDDKASEGYVVASVDRAIQLLLTLSDMPHSGVTELAEATGTTKSMTFRLLYTLERRGLVRKDRDRSTYAVGYRAMFLGDRAREQSHLITTARPYLRQISRDTGENALLLVREGLTTVCVAFEESPQPLRVFSARGRIGPLHAGGGPKLLLAYAPQEIRDEVLSGPLEVYTEKTMSDPEQLAAALARIKADGIVVSVGEIDPNTFSVSAPVRDQSGDVIASLSVNGPAARLNDETEARIREAVLEGAAELTRTLGGPADHG